ncbi:diacylglycerol/lipid kinase family protein [Thermophagus xiamenensis]|uniref:Lipid kinase, YegS/Rv2252/BmrU family n=1 Tax=Thermophagus xiamenensis TaxID=385682 RepID=A0A1I1VTM9_9BACT|nr:diacylglycerol kinase family protein [Thermophagus xiamenensis]SFD86271.1 lipid kinase, YegS/Rv2252/BmrU family [Thermophagus xiamenensis]
MQAKQRRKVLFVINPVSGSNTKTDIREQIVRLCKKKDMQPFFIATTGENDCQQIEKALDECHPEILVAVGGDGTVNLAAQVLNGRTDIKLGIIPTGSANGMAFELNIPTSLENAMNIIARNVSKPIDLLKINNQHLAVHLSDIGLNARIIKRFDEEKIRGFYGYAKQFFKELKAPAPFRCTIKVKKRTRMYRAVMVVMLNTHFYGTGAIINPKGRMDDGKFEIVIIKPYPWYYIFSMFFAFFTGNIHKLRHVKIKSYKRAQIILNPPQDLQIDGEPLGEVSQIEIEIIPSAIEVIYNDQEDHLFFSPAEKK